MEKAIKRYWPVFVLPTLIAFIIGFVWPFIWGTGLSFCKFTTVKNVSFVGLSNYKMIWSDATFMHAFWFTAAFTVVSTVLVNVLAFGIALLLTRGMRGTNVFRTVFFLPNLVGGIVLGYIWQILLNGLLTAWGKPLLALNATYGFWGLIVLMCWQQIGYMMIIYIAGLQNVPTDLIEAARIDGASELTTFTRIALPIIKPGIGALAIFTFINSWNDYFMQLIMLSSTSKLTISLGIAKLQAENSTDYGLIMAGAALAAVPIIIVFLAFQKYFTKGITMGAVKG